jgi:hypothetical protein
MLIWPKRGNGTQTFVIGNWMGNLHIGNYSPPPPLLLKPGEKKEVTVDIDLKQLTLRDFTALLSKDIFIRAGLYQAMGKPTEDENQQLMKQYHLVNAAEYS